MFVKVPQWVLEKPGITITKLATYVAARSFASKQGGSTKCWPGIAKICVKFDQSEATVRMALRYFERGGMLKRSRRF